MASSKAYGRESLLVSKILQQLRNGGGLWFKTSPGPYTKNGISDIIGCRSGHFYAIEVKHQNYFPRPWRALSEQQKAFLKVVDREGGFAAVACLPPWETGEQPVFRFHNGTFVPELLHYR